ncbi:MAG: DHH family phosphoesterase [Candidatus Aenigmarchaeota archaeon]|nr:DHH family phosphoesterase [Candidatus Aenigmarchaeota archaeon]
MKEEAVQFLKNLNERVKIISHNDVDGVCSLAIMQNLLEKRGIEYWHRLTKVPIEKLEKAETMIFLDINNESALRFASEKTLIIDHHQFKEKPTLPFYNPRETDERSYIPASYLAYEVCSELENMDEMKWIAAVGVVGDKGDENSEVCRKFVEGAGSKQEFDLVSDYMFSAGLVEGIKGDEKVLEILKEVRSAKEILQDAYLKNCYEEIQRELSKSNNQAEKDGNIIFVEIKSKYNIKSIVANNILEKNEGVIVVAYSEFEDCYNMSARTNTDVNLGEIIGKVAKTCGGDGGGHRKAAGAEIGKDKLEVFKEMFISAIKNLK